mmetsp:Transcript_1528/g.1879  ORF Transcript_1528/g.1879 Transcript_1528/m.1879 type:complete len:504 (-) Transcript_1528:424-1935(-)
MDQRDDELKTLLPQKHSEITVSSHLLNPWSISSAGIILSFGVAGYSNQAYGTPLVYYMYDSLDISTQEYYVYKALTTVPELLIVIYGFIGEMYPIRGKRCKYLLALGLIVNILSLGSLYLLKTPSYNQVIWLAFLAKAGTYCHYSMGFMLAQDRSLMESDSRRGTFYMTGLILNSLGAVLGQLLSTSYSTTIAEIGGSLAISWGGLDFSQLCLASVMIPILALPAVLVIVEDDASPSNFTEEANRLLDLLAEPYVYGPVIGFTGIKFFTTSNSAEAALLLDGCGVNEFQYTVMAIACMFTAWVTNIVYRDYFFPWGFRLMYALTIGVNVVSMFNDMIGVDLVGTQVPACIYYLGFDDLIGYFSSYSQIAVHSVVVLLMCQGARNGKQNLMITSMVTAGWCLEEVCADFYSTWVDVSTVALSKHRYKGYYELQLICIGVTCMGFFLLPLIPSSREDFVECIKANNARPTDERRSYSMATGLLLWWSFAVVFTIVFAAFQNWFLG